MRYVSGGRRRVGRVGVAVGGVVLVAGAVGGCGSSGAEDAPVESRAFPFSGTSLTIASDNSALEIVAADVRDVEVTRQVDGWVVFGNGPEKSWRLEDGKLALKVRCEGLVSNCGGRHTVRVPKGVTVTVEDGNGGVTASGFTTALKITSDNGKVEVRDSSGPLDLYTDNGGVVTERVTSTTVKAGSDNGAVRLRLDAVPERVEAVSDNGRVEIGLPGAGAPYAVTARSDNGDVDVSVPRDDASDRVVSARSDNGKVVVRTAN